MDEVDVAQEYEEKMRDGALAQWKHGHPDGATADHPKCQSCRGRIPIARRRAQPGCRLCIDCQQAAEARQRVQGGVV